MTGETKPLTPDAKDQIRAACAQHAQRLFGEVMDRRGGTAEVVVLVAEGLLAGIVVTVWRNRREGFGKWWVRRVLHGLLRRTIREVCRERR